MAADLPTGINLYQETIILLAGAVICAPLFKKIGLGTVLGYLAAGLIIGPIVGIVRDGEEILHFAELGVVFLLFLVGLELKPARLWALRQDIFGIGLLQVVISAVILAAICVVAGYTWQTSAMIGAGLALSSTAFALQILNERGEFNTAYGEKSFSILLFQDLAIVPLLAMIPLLAPFEGETSGEPFWLVAGKSLACIVGLILAGRYLLNPLFRIIANTGAREMMIAVALFVVLGAGLLMQFAGFSMAMGSFIAGVMLAESAYRHELEADIEPFRGLLLGLFFMAVGLSVDLDAVFANWATILIATPIMMLIKGFVIYALLRIFGSSHNDSIRATFLLPQAGEFGFVLFSAGLAAGVVDSETAAIVTAIVTVSMAVTPISVRIRNYFLKSGPEADELEEDFDGAGGSALIISFGRFGQVLSQILLSKGIPVTVLDNNAERIRNAANFGFKIYYGNGKRLDVLRAAGADRVKVIAVCVDSPQDANHIVEMIKSEMPQAKILVRAQDRAHALELIGLDVDYQLREVFESAMVFGGEILRQMDIPETEIEDVLDEVRKRDLARLELQAVEGIYAGSDMLRPVMRPEPLTKPAGPAKSLTEETEKIAQQDPTS